MKLIDVLTYNNVIYHINNLYNSISFKVNIVLSINIQLEDIIFSSDLYRIFFKKKVFMAAFFKSTLGCYNCRLGYFDKTV